MPLCIGQPYTRLQSGWSTETQTKQKPRLSNIKTTTHLGAAGQASAQTVQAAACRPWVRQACLLAGRQEQAQQQRAWGLLPVLAPQALASQQLRGAQLPVLTARVQQQALVLAQEWAVLQGQVATQQQQEPLVLMLE